MNKKHYFLFIVKYISFVQFLFPHQERKGFSIIFPPNFILVGVSILHVHVQSPIVLYRLIGSQLETADY